MRDINKSNQTKLSDEDIINICNDYFIKNKSYGDICKQYRIGSQRLKKILIEYKNNKENNDDYNKFMDLADTLNAKTRKVNSRRMQLR